MTKDYTADENTSVNLSGRIVRPACRAGVLTSRGVSLLRRYVIRCSMTLKGNCWAMTGISQHQRFLRRGGVGLNSRNRDHL